MALLKVDTKRKEYKLVGVSLPPQEHVYMSLYCLAKGITKTKILKQLIEEWLCTHKPKESKGALIRELKNRIERNWEELSKKGVVLEDYKDQVKEELIDKIPVDIINNILIDIGNAKDN